MRVPRTGFAGGRGLIRIDETASIPRGGTPTNDASRNAFGIDRIRVDGNASGTSFASLGRGSADALVESGTGPTRGSSRLLARTGVIRS